MKLTKSFVMHVTGRYQAYDFSTTMETEIPERILGDDDKLEKFTIDFQDAVVQSTLSDIDRLLQADPIFALVWNARKEEFEAYEKALNKLRQQKEAIK